MEDSKNLIGEIVGVEKLSQIQIEQMYDLMSRYYDNTNLRSFQRDLSEKKDVIILRNPSEHIKGFSTLKVLEQMVDGKPIAALFSGDTIIDKEYWGGSELPRWWGRYALSLVDKMPDKELYWFLMSKGYKTYKFLPVFFNEFYPRYDREFPAREKRILDALAYSKFPQNYNSKKGIVCFQGSKDHLKQGVAEIDECRMKDPHVKFFVEKNPQWYNGDELCCIMPIRKDNFNRMMLRVIGNN